MTAATTSILRNSPGMPWLREISNAYYPAADRTFGKTADKWGEQIGLDAFFNVAKEFWPDVRKKFFGQQPAGVSIQDCEAVISRMQQ